MLFLKARAKINWTLDVLGRRADGYHELDMLMQSVALCDTLWLEPSDALTLEAADDHGGSLDAAIFSDTLSSLAVSYDDDNLVLRAAKALQKRCGHAHGARMILLKRIPSGAGMGGGSADAAAALVGLDKLWGLGLSHEALCDIGLTLGADVPFMLAGGLARVGGVGERIRPLSPAPVYPLLVVQPCGGLSTKEIFGAFDNLGPQSVAHPRTEDAQRALLSGDLDALGAAMDNSLEGVSVAHRPEIAQAKRALEGAGAVRAMMTGSGSAVYGAFESRERAEAALATLRPRYEGCVLTHTTDAGVVLA